MGVRIFTSPRIRKELGETDLQSVVEKFRKYKESGDHQDFFGRDVTFDRPQSVVFAGLEHVHLNAGSPWGLRLLQIRRKSDKHLVYCKGFFKSDCFLLITLVMRAHERYRNDLYMLDLADIGSAFRSKY